MKYLHRLDIEDVISLIKSKNEIYVDYGLNNTNDHNKENPVKTTMCQQL